MDYFRGIQEMDDGSAVAPFLVSDDPLDYDSFLFALDRAANEGVRLTHIALNYKGLVDIICLSSFPVEFFHPVRELAIIRQGLLGTINELKLVTDAHRPPQERFLTNRISYYNLPEID